MSQHRCQGAQHVAPEKLPPCPVTSTTHREHWRWGDVTQGEALVINFMVPLCEPCASEWDARVNDARIEVLAS